MGDNDLIRMFSRSFTIILNTTFLEFKGNQSLLHDLKLLIRVALASGTELSAKFSFFDRKVKLRANFRSVNLNMFLNLINLYHRTFHLMTSFVSLPSTLRMFNKSFLSCYKIYLPVILSSFTLISSWSDQKICSELIHITIFSHQPMVLHA